MSDTIETVNAFFDGRAVGIRDYAWWSDGTQYVGTCGKTLESAIRDMELDRAHRLKYVEAEASTATEPSP